MAGRVLGDDYLTADGEYCAAPLYSEGVEKWRRLENAEREKQALQSVLCPIAGIFAHAVRPFAQRLATVRFPGSIQIPEGHSKLFQFPHVRRDDHADGERMGVPSDGAVSAKPPWWQRGCVRPRYQRCTDAPGPPVSESSTASARSFRPRAPMTLSTVSRLGLRSPDSAL